MAFDAGMVACLCHELNQNLIGAKIDKIYQPAKDEIFIVFRNGGQASRLLLSCAPGTQRVVLTAEKPENPLTAPMLCMLLRKHLIGAKLTDIQQPDFERVLIFTFSCYDEMGDPCVKYLAAEMLGKFSNLILLDQSYRILGAVKTVDFSTSEKRQILAGLRYELPPKQDKVNPLNETKEGFVQRAQTTADGLQPADRFILSSYAGISPLIAKEIVYRAHKVTKKPLCECDFDKLWFYFDLIVRCIREQTYHPVLIADHDGRAVEYSFVAIEQYGATAACDFYESPSLLVETFFETRAKAERHRQKAADVFKILSNAESRLTRKIALQTEELSLCSQKDEYKQYADLIHAHMYLIKRGMKSISVQNYYSQTGEMIDIPLDERLSPSANAQRYYKKYNKAKVAQTELNKQIDIAKADLDYLYTVFDALTRAETTAEIDEIRQELAETGFAVHKKGETKKKTMGKPLAFISTDGYRMLCGKNNIQNDQLTFKMADKNDYWFHVKNAPGSHVILCCNGEEPPERAFTEAARLAASHSKLAEGENVPVDYTKVKNVKKPPGAKPGYVIYHTNWTAYVSPEKIERGS
ncbi:MAG: fibronectin/fibrinogen-binding protein [Clostridiales bacterium]|nr:fibronectin/fibrinogen-binding protein [Clostridiales bacterium]